MSAGFLKNGCKSYYSINSLLKRHSISDSIAAPILRTQQQQSKAYAQFPNSFYRKAREFDLSPPSILSSPFSSTSSSSSSSTIGLGFVGWYLGMVKSHPIFTKSVTSGLIYTTADFSSQTIARPSSEPYDILRTMRMAAYGMLILGPTMHFYFNFVSKVLPKRDVMTTLKKILLGQAIYGPIMTVVFFSVNAGLQGENGSEIVARLKRDVLPTMINGVMYWPFCDFVTFKFIPVHLQPLVSNSFSYLWTIYITYMASLEKAGAN